MILSNNDSCVLCKYISFRTINCEIKTYLIWYNLYSNISYLFWNIIFQCTNQKFHHIGTNYTINYSVLNRFLVSHPPIILDRNLLSWVHISIRYRCGQSVISVCPFSLPFSSSFLFYKNFLLSAFAKAQYYILLIQAASVNIQSAIIRGIQAYLHPVSFPMN